MYLFSGRGELLVLMVAVFLLFCLPAAAWYVARKWAAVRSGGRREGRASSAASRTARER